MTLDEAKKIAEELLGSACIDEAYVEGARLLAAYVLGLLPGVNVIEIESEPDTIPPEPFAAAPSVIPISIEEEDTPVSITFDNEDELGD